MKIGTVASQGILSPKTILLKVIHDTDPLTTGDGKGYLTIPSSLNGMNMIEVAAHVYAASISGIITIAVYNVTKGQDMLSTNITIDANEKDSATAAIPVVINTAADDVSTANEIRIDVDGAGANAQGLEMRLSFKLP